jgi:hypothetical protein
MAEQVEQQSKQELGADYLERLGFEAEQRALGAPQVDEAEGHFRPRHQHHKHPGHEFAQEHHQQLEFVDYYEVLHSPPFQTPHTQPPDCEHLTEDFLEAESFEVGQKQVCSVRAGEEPELPPKPLN